MKLPALGLLILSGVWGAQAETRISLLTLDPGHFHAALIQKTMYPQVDPVVRVYSPGGPDLDLHLERIEGFNSRPDNPTRWKEIVYTGPDYMEKMIGERAGNVVVISGNNSRKGTYILGCVRAGFHVLSDKPMAVTPEDFQKLKEAFTTASSNRLLLYDIMPERSDITSVLQRELARREALFGKLEPGSPENPSVIQENIHHFAKEVAGKPLVRPPWFFDVKQQGEGIVDVTTHLVDLVQCGAFPEQVLEPSDARVLKARCWTTAITAEQFQRITQLPGYPEYLRPYLDAEGVLQVRSNASFVYTLRGIHARVGVEWLPGPGSGDSHYSLMRGSRAELIVRQGAGEGFVPTLYVENRSGTPEAAFEASLKTALEQLAATWPGLDFTRAGTAWKILIPEKYREGHEARFAKVATTFFGYLERGEMPEWERAGMLTKYATLMQAYALSRQ